MMRCHKEFLPDVWGLPLYWVCEVQLCLRVFWHLLVVVVLLDATQVTLWQLQVLEIDGGSFHPESDDSVDFVGRICVVLVVAQQQLQVIVDVRFSVFGESKPETWNIIIFDFTMMCYFNFMRQLKTIKYHDVCYLKLGFITIYEVYLSSDTNPTLKARLNE